MITTLGFHFRGHGFDPWSGNYDSTCHAQPHPQDTALLHDTEEETCTVYYEYIKIGESDLFLEAVKVSLKKSCHFKVHL